MNFFLNTKFNFARNFLWYDICINVQDRTNIFENHEWGSEKESAQNDKKLRTPKAKSKQINTEKQKVKISSNFIQFKNKNYQIIDNEAKNWCQDSCWSCGCWFIRILTGKTWNFGENLQWKDQYKIILIKSGFLNKSSSTLLIFLILDILLASIDQNCKEKWDPARKFTIFECCFLERIYWCLNARWKESGFYFR